MASAAPAQERVPGAPDCTIVLDPTGMQLNRAKKHTAVADSAKDIASAVPHASSSCGTLADAAQEADQVPTTAAPAPRRPRTYYIDWLRVFLTVVVVLHHSVTVYQSSYVWAAKKGDTTLWLFSQLFVYGNQAYFMTLFFFLSGLYVPGSYKRKGPVQFLWDRTLRLVLPCILYSFLMPPVIMMWNEVAKNPKTNPSVALANAFRTWLKPGWPSTYVLPTGPPWFVWMLWCFNVAYVIVKLVAGAIPALKRRELTKLPSANKLPLLTFTTRQMLVYTSAVAGFFFTTCFAMRMLDTFAFNIRPTIFVVKGPFVSFMPDYLPVYLGAFALGMYAGPAGWDVLARLPDSWGSWSLWVGGIWWVVAGFLLNVTLNSWMNMQRGTQAFVLTWLLRTFVEQTFCVIWSVGLIVVFRQAYNVKPNWFGRQMIGGAYGAYLVHLPIVMLYARALMVFPTPSAVLNFVAISPMAVISAWLVACALRAIPGADKVL